MRSAWRLVCSSVIVLTVTWPWTTRATPGHAAVAHAAVKRAVHRHVRNRTHKKDCVSKVIDTFSHGPYQMNLTQNASLEVKHGKVGASSNIGVLEASATATDQAFSVGRRFPAAQNWHRATGIGLWYYGRHTGKRVGVQILGKEAADPGPSGWQLAWSDEFNGPAGTAPDSAVWSHDMGDGSKQGNPGWGNHELESYTDSSQNAALDGNGNLLITARKAGSGSCYYGACQYTSARLLTQHKLELQYGRIEARIKLPQGAGTWPAFWALGTNIAHVGWPQSGEIDIMEHVGRLPHQVFGTIHGPGYSGAAGFQGSHEFAGDAAASYHTFSIEWQPNLIVWSVDGIEYHRATPQNVTPNQWVFNHPFFLLLNLAVGGDFGGPVGPDVAFPQTMAVDYVRVYGAPDTAERFASSFKDTFSGWRQIVLPFRSFHRSADQPAGAPTTRFDPRNVRGYAVDLPADYGHPARLAKVEALKRTAAGSCSG